MWWLGSIRANWEQVCGPKTWTWLRTWFLCFRHKPYAVAYTLLTDKNARSPDWSVQGQGVGVSPKPAVQRGRRVAASEAVAERIAMMKATYR
jgi:hypothetical protein